MMNRSSLVQSKDQRGQASPAEETDRILRRRRVKDAREISDPRVQQVLDYRNL